MADGTRLVDPSRLCQLEIPVADVGRALAFYAAAFGWQRSPAELHDYVVLDVPAHCSFGVALVVDDKARQDGRPRSGPTLYFAVEDPEAIARAVVAAGGRQSSCVSRDAAYGAVCHVEDPDGNRFGLHQEAGRSAAAR